MYWICMSICDPLGMLSKLEFMALILPCLNLIITQCRCNYKMHTLANSKAGPLTFIFHSPSVVVDDGVVLQLLPASSPPASSHSVFVIDLISSSPRRQWWLSLQLQELATKTLLPGLELLLNGILSFAFPQSTRTTQTRTVYLTESYLEIQLSASCKMWNTSATNKHTGQHPSDRDWTASVPIAREMRIIKVGAINGHCSSTARRS